MSDEGVDAEAVELEELNALDVFMNDQKSMMDTLAGQTEVNGAKTTLFDDFKVFERDNKLAVSALNFDIPDSIVFD